MKTMKKVLVSSLGLSLLLSPGFTPAEAQGKGKQKVVDKNKNEIADNWEKKYKLSGKNVASLDNDKDGLNNLVEYKLNLNPTLADTNKNGTLDGQEDQDKDGLSNVAEGDLSLNPLNPDTDKDKIKDGDEKGKDGIAFSDKIRELEIEISTDKHDIEIEYEVKKGKSKIKVKDKSRTVTKEMVAVLANELQDPATLTEEEIIAKIQDLFNITGPFSIEMEIEFADGEELEIEQEVDNDDQNDNGDDDQEDNDDDQDDEDDK
ncbi:hypothetical protein [Domibacillus iocasae]|nr:hypothetical protein [Domibacillus iocasae]